MGYAPRLKDPPFGRVQLPSGGGSGVSDGQNCTGTLRQHFNYNSHCVIVLYRLYDCGIRDEGCAALTSALKSNPSHLRELDLSRNILGDSVQLLSDVLQNPHCKLEKVW